MRNIKWLTILCIAVLIAFSALCVRGLFSVADIIVNYEVYDLQTMDEANAIVGQYRGTSLVFLKERDITEIFNQNTNLKVNSVQKKYPHTLIIDIKERKESFAVKAGDVFFILDDEYSIVDKRGNFINSVDGMSNILIEFMISDFNIGDLQVRSTLNIGSEALFDAVKQIIGEIDSARDFVKSICIEEKEKGSNYYIYIKTLEGVEFEIRKILEFPKEKASVGIQKYRTLKDGERLLGRIACYAMTNGEIVASYTTQ